MKINIKATEILETGIAQYLNSTALTQEQIENITKKEFQLLESGLLQLKEGIGVDENNPLTNLDVNTVYKLIYMLDLKLNSRNSKYSFLHQNEKGILDILSLSNGIDSEEICLYHFVKSYYKSKKNVKRD